MTKILAVIPARSGSKSIKDKNLLKIKGKSFLELSILTAKKSNLINRIIVSTDSEKYAKLSEKFGAEVPFLRPKSISKDNSHDKEFFTHLIEKLKNLEGYLPEYIIHLRPTTPIRKASIIDDAIKKFIEKKSFNSLRSVQEMSESSFKTFEVSGSSLKPLSFLDLNIEDLNRPRQSFPKTYQANGYVDIISVDFFLKKNELHGEKVMAFLTDPVIEIDSIHDYKNLKARIEKK
tara:strand:- start:13691 stop:14389 length:699 start_codon:yes stop_codon:yes gene_type:complete